MAVERGDAAGLNKTAAVAGWLRARGGVRQLGKQTGFIRTADAPQRAVLAQRVVHGPPISDNPQIEPVGQEAQPEHSARHVVSGRGVQLFRETITKKPHLYRLPDDKLEDPQFAQSDITRYVASNEAVHAAAVGQTRENLTHPDQQVRADAVRAAGLLDAGEQRDSALRTAFADPEAKVKIAAFEVAGLLPNLAEVEKYITDTIPDPDADPPVKIDNALVAAAVAALRVVPDIDRREHLLREAQTDIDAINKHIPTAIAAELLPPERRVHHVLAGITDPDVMVRLTSIACVSLLPPEQRGLVLDEVLQFEPSDVIKQLATQLLLQVPFEERDAPLRRAESETGPVRIAGRKVRVEHDAERGRRMLSSRSEEDRIAVLEGQISDISSEVQLIGSRNLSLVCEDNRRQLIAAHPDHFQTFVEAASAIPLYGEQEDDFVRKEMTGKTGSTILLLDRVPNNKKASLRGQAIMRTQFPLSSYLQWEKAYEAGDFWEEQLGYVPVEPIIRVRKNYKNPMQVSIITRVLNGPTVNQWTDIPGAPYKDEIAASVEKIKHGLEALGITHGHTHPDNFVVVFERDGNGVPDLARPPRVYVIDFDRAKDSKE